MNPKNTKLRYLTPWLAALAMVGSSALAATRTAVGNSTWSSASAWSPAGVPAAGDDVVIPAGITVVYDANSSAIINTVTINGTLTFDTTVDTNLDVGVITIGAPGMADSPQPGTLVVGDSENPVPRGVSATIRLAETSGQVSSKHPGILCNGGRIIMHGSRIANPWVKLRANANTGSTNVKVEGSYIGDWEVGDEILIVATNNGNSGFGSDVPTYNQAKWPNSVARSETRTITAIDYSTGHLSFSGGLSYHHHGLSGNYPEVANLTRTVTVTSLDRSDDTSRGHTLIGAHSSGYIQYGRFDGLGKEGVLGRYPIHIHMPAATSRGFSIVGNAITDSHNKFVTLHSCNYVLVRDNIGFQCFTSGFFMEDGTEVYNLWDRNLAVQAMTGSKAPNEALDYLNGEGFGFWWANARNAVINNVSAENDRFGYFYQVESVKWYYGVRQNPNPNSTAKVDLWVPMLQEDGTTASTKLKSVRMFRFDNNEAHTEHSWGFVIKGGSWSVSNPSVLTNTRSWSTHYPFDVHCHGILIDRIQSWKSNYGLELGRIGNGQHTDNITFRDAFLLDASVQYLNCHYAGANTVFAGTTSLLRSSSGFQMGSSIFPKSPNFSSTVVIEDLVEDYPDRIFGGSGESGYNDFVYVNNRYGAGLGAKIKGNSNSNPGDGLTYSLDPELNYTSNKTASVPNFTDYTAISAVDLRKPASAITSVGGSPGSAHDVEFERASNGSVTLQGYAIDDGAIAGVSVNGVAATALQSDWSEWTVTLPGVALGNATFTCTATDASGKVEANPHSLTVSIIDAGSGSTVVLSATKDTYVDALAPNDNFGSLNVMRTKSGGSYSTRYSYLGFDLSGVSSVGSATLRVYGANASFPTTITCQSTTNGSWNESAVTWNSRPSFSAVLDSASVGINGSYTEWDVTSFVQANGGNTIGFGLTSGTSAVGTFQTKEGSNPPELVITP